MFLVFMLSPLQSFKTTVQFLSLDLTKVFVYINVSRYVVVLSVHLYDVGLLYIYIYLSVEHIFGRFSVYLANDDNVN